MTLRRNIFLDEHEAFRAVVRKFIAREVRPAFGEWERNGLVPRDLYSRLGDLGIFGMAIPVEYGGGGIADYRYNVVLQEEAANEYVTLGTCRTQLDVILPYFLAFANAEQRARWFPGMASGALVTAIAMTEPGTGSDLAGIRTAAHRAGEEYIVNGAKTFITGGHHADLVIVVARTSEAEESRKAGLSLIVVEANMPGFEKGRRLSKIGLRAQDTNELSFTDVRVPVTNLLGEEGAAFEYLSRNLPRERLAIAVGSVAQSRAALTTTIDYVTHRAVFGRPLSSFQNTKFELASCATEIAAAEALLDNAIEAHIAGALTPADAAKVKLFCTETQGRVVDRCLQLFGGYGYISDFPIARLYADARVSRVYGGTSEIMKAIISKDLGL